VFLSGVPHEVNPLIVLRISLKFPNTQKQWTPKILNDVISKGQADQVQIILSIDPLQGWFDL